MREEKSAPLADFSKNQEVKEQPYEHTNGCTQRITVYLRKLIKAGADFIFGYKCSYGKSLISYK